MRRWVLVGALFGFGSVGVASQKAIAPELGKIHDGKKWSMVNAVAETAVESGASVVRTHDVAPTVDAVKVAVALKEAGKVKS